MKTKAIIKRAALAVLGLVFLVAGHCLFVPINELMRPYPLGPFFPLIVCTILLVVGSTMFVFNVIGSDTDD